jgi:hypothetical protein
MAMDPKKKKILEDADKAIQAKQALKSQATEDIQRQTGVKSSVEYETKKIADNARALLGQLPKGPEPKDKTSAEDYGKMATAAMAAMGKKPEDDPKKKKKTLLTGK